MDKSGKIKAAPNVSERRGEMKNLKKIILMFDEIGHFFLKSCFR